MTLEVKIDLDKLIEHLKKTNDVEFLHFVDELIQSGEIDISRFPEELRWKIIDSREPVDIDEEDEKAIKEGLKDIENGDVILHEELQRELGL